MEEKTFEFKNIFYEVINEDKNIESKYARLLDGISGTFKSGRLTAVMGASGAGKSTLFDVLLGRIDNSSKSYCSIKFNGKERTESEWIHKVSYLRQFDIFFPKFSIMESVMYNLDFYQPNKSRKEKIKFAEEILKCSNIWEKRYAYVESLSGGECKRAMIALSLCADPEIIFMDEPTSGLDSHSALTLINFMKGYAEKNNKIVIISLHQPGEGLFNLFTDILYLGRGAVFYEGKLDNIGKWLQSKGISKIEGISLAEYLFELHSDNPFPPEIANTKPTVDRIIEENRQEYNELRSEIELKKGISNLLCETSLSFKAIFTLFWRFYLNIWRTKFFSFMITKLLGLAVVSICTYIHFLLFKSDNVLLLMKIGVKIEADSSLYSILEKMKEKLTPITKNFYTYSEIVNLFGIGQGTAPLYTGLFALHFIFKYNPFTDKIFYLEDIYSGKYSKTTCFIANLLNECLGSLFWLIWTPVAIYLSPIRTILSYAFFPNLITIFLATGITLVFIKHLLGGFGSTIVFIIISLLSVFKLGFLYYNLVPWGLKCQKFELNIETIENDEEIPTEFDGNVGFSCLDLDQVPSIWIYYLLFLLSLIFTISATFYLFNRQIKAYLRLKLN